MFNNSNKKMLSLANCSINTYGKDQTGKITYKFDPYGFREGNNYNIIPSTVFFGCSFVAGIGINTNERFSNYFNNSWNFGLFGEYTEDEIISNYEMFKKQFTEYKKTKIVFCWRSDDIDYLEMLIHSMDTNIYHTVPVDFKLKNFKIMRNIENIDYDVSKTHYGPKSHQKFSTLLWHFLKKY